MTVKLSRIRPYFSHSVFVLLNNHQYNCNFTKSFLIVIACFKYVSKCTQNKVFSHDCDYHNIIIIGYIFIPLFFNVIDVVRTLIEAEVDLDCINDSGRTPLHLAVWNRDYIITRLLIRRQCNTEIRDIYGDTPLLLCVRKGFMDITRLLMKSGCDVTATSRERDSVVHYAAANGRMSILELLIASGADMNGRNVWQHTPLLLAVQSKQVETSLFLIENGCDVHALDRSGKTALFHCIRRNMSVVMLQLMLKGVSPNSVDDDGLTPLYEAVCHNDVEIIKMLIQFKANVNVLGKTTINGVYRHCTPLEIALVKNNNIAVTILLISAGSDATKVRHILEAGDIADEIVRNDTFLSWLEEMSTGPPKLSYISRLAIRNAIPGYIVPCISNLPVPPMIKNYLSFQDVFETMEFFQYR